MSKNILKDMRDQMSPDVELIESLMKRIEDDAVFRVENVAIDHKGDAKVG